MKYVQFPLSLLSVEDLLHKTVRAWRKHFGPVFAAEIRKRWIQGPSFWLCHLGEVFVWINGEQHTFGGRSITKARY
jgi:putative transposase